MASPCSRWSTRVLATNGRGGRPQHSTEAKGASQGLEPIADLRLVARADANVRVRTGDQVKLTFLKAQVQIFDRETDRSLLN